MVAYSWAIDYADLITHGYKILERKKKLRTPSAILVTSSSVLGSIIHLLKGNIDPNKSKPNVFFLC